MGVSYSSNQVDQVIKNIIDISNTAAQKSEVKAVGVQSLSCQAGRDVNISDVDMTQDQAADMSVALSKLSDDTAVQTSVAEMKQLAQAVTKGLNFGNVSVAQNFGSQIQQNATTIVNELKSDCKAEVSAFQISNSIAGRDCNITRVRMTQVQDVMSTCSANMVSKNSVLQKAKALADQTAIAKTEGLDIMGWLMLGLIIILVLPIVLISVKGKSGGGGGASKAGTVILGFLGGGLLLSGIIMAAVGDKETITLYGYVNQADFAECGTPSGPVITNVKDVGEGGASTKCLRMNEENPGSCEGFYFDETSKTMQVYKDIKNKPCDGMTNLMENPDANAGKKWAGFVQTPHKIRNIGLGLIGGGALCIIILVIFMFMKKKGEAASAAAVPTQ